MITASGVNDNGNTVRYWLLACWRYGVVAVFWEDNNTNALWHWQGRTQRFRKVASQLVLQSFRGLTTILMTASKYRSSANRKGRASCKLALTATHRQDFILDSRSNPIGASWHMVLVIKYSEAEVRIPWITLQQRHTLT